jgi:photosystem II stability/assembly factor-like uncharacterized protein
MRKSQLLLLPLLLTMAAATAEAGYVNDSDLEYRTTGVSYSVSDFLDDGQHGWIVGRTLADDPRLTVVFRTTDGGDSWERIETPLTGYPKEVDFVNANDGWLVSHGTQRAYRTRDGGRTWREDSCAGGWGDRRLRDLKMLSATEGYGCGQTGDEGCFFEYDGRRWRPLPSEVDIPIALHTMDAIDATHMWAIGTGPADAKAFGRLGSERIERMDVGIFPCPWSLHFYDENNGWIGSGATIVHTTDGGRTWEEQEIWTLHAVRDIHFISPTEGRACTHLGELLRTSDGGDTWRKDRITTGALSDVDRWQDGWQITGIQGLFSWRQPTLATGTAQIRPIIPTHEPERNPDERDWVELDSLDEVLGTATIACAEFLGNDHIWLAAQDGLQPVVIFSSDAGRTWERVEVPLPHATIHDIDFADEDAGWLSCTGDRPVWHTTDGGHSWAPQNHQDRWADDGRVSDLEMLSPELGYAVYFVPGSDSRLLSWTNRSDGWFARDIGINDHFHHLEFQAEDRAWLVKHGARAWRGVGDMEFVPMTTGEPGAIGCVFMLGHRRGWMGGRQRIVRTRDGGESWHEQEAPITSPRATVNGIYFRDARHGAAVTSAGDVLLTDDGGLEWKQTAPPSSARRATELSGLRDVAWFNGEWMVVGRYGLYRTAPTGPMRALHPVGSLVEALAARDPAPPRLQWYGEDPWAERGHMLSEPEVHRLDHLRVMYMDPNGDEPREVVAVITDPSGATERRQLYPMHHGSFRTGKVYERPYGWALNGGYRYHFEATDATGREAAGPATAEQSVYVSRRGEPRY